MLKLRDGIREFYRAQQKADPFNWMWFYPSMAFSLLVVLGVIIGHVPVIMRFFFP